MRRAIVIPDTHFPIHDESAVKVVLKAIEFVKPNIFINLGDVGEWESVSAWQYKRRKRPPIEYQLREMVTEIKEVNKCIDRFDKVLDKIKCKERYILAGNHDEWLDSWWKRILFWINTHSEMLVSGMKGDMSIESIMKF